MKICKTKIIVTKICKNYCDENKANDGITDYLRVTIK